MSHRLPSTHQDRSESDVWKEATSRFRSGLRCRSIDFSAHFYQVLSLLVVLICLAHPEIENLKRLSELRIFIFSRLTHPMHSALAETTVSIQKPHWCYMSRNNIGLMHIPRSYRHDYTLSTWSQFQLIVLKYALGQLCSHCQPCHRWTQKGR